MKIVNLLNRVLKSQGQQLPKENEYMYWSPFVAHHKPKLQVNIKNGKWHCWVSGEGGHNFFQLFKKVGVTQKYYDELRQLSNEFVSYNHIPKIKSKKDVKLPDEYKPLWIPTDDPIYKNAIYYLRKRKINAREIIRYSIGYCDRGPYSNRIIIPSYDECGKLNYFIARDIFPNSKFKYKNPPMSKDTVCFELFINWNEPIILCEGVFDAITIRNNVIPLLGKFPSKTLVKRLVEKKVKTIYVALDEDAKKDAIKLSKFLMDYGISTYLLDMKGKDPSELGFIKFWEIVKNTKQSKFSDIIKGRLYA